MVSSSARPLLWKQLLCALMQLGVGAGSPPVHPRASIAPKSTQELLIHLLSLNFLPEAGSCAGGLSAVKQHVKHAGTELALQVSAAWHCFPMNVGMQTF